MSSSNSPERIATLTQEILQTLGRSIDRIRELNESTHVLAINARIEAARAGVQGRGFRVVAEAFSQVNQEIQIVSQQLTEESRTRLDELLTISDDLSGAVRGQRLTSLAHFVMEIVDRNLYERSCDVRWWATEAAVVEVLQAPEEKAQAQKRLGVILDSYTVYFDIVVVDLQGRVVANGRPETYAIDGIDVSREPWFTSALALNSGRDFGFQSLHRGALAGGAPVLVFSCPVGQGGNPEGEPLGVLGVVFRWEGLGPVCLADNAQAIDGAVQQAIVDASGRILTQTGTVSFGGSITWPGASELLKESGSAFRVVENGTERFVLARGLSPGFETYATDWSCLILQRI